MLWWIWLLVGLVLFVVELLTPGGFYLLFFGVGAIGVGLLARFGLAGPQWVEWLLFSVISIAALLLFRRPLLTRFRLSVSDKDIDSLVGETAMALEDIAADGIGKAEMRGTAWSARNVGGNPVKRGQRCKVERIEGLMLWVRSQ